MDGSIDWGYLGRGVGVALAAAGLAVGAGLALGGSGALLAALVGGLLLLAYLSATTGTPSDTVAGELSTIGDEGHIGEDTGFAVRDSMLFVAVGLLVGGVALLAALY